MNKETTAKSSSKAAATSREAKPERSGLLVFQPAEIMAGDILLELAPDSTGAKGFFFLDTARIERIEARWRLRSHAFTSAMVGLLSELTNEHVNLDDFKKPAFRERLDEDLTPLLCGVYSTLSPQELLKECWDTAIELARNFHDRSPTAAIVKAVNRENGKVTAKILNRYGLTRGDSPLKGSGYLIRAGIVRSLDAARVLRDRGEFCPNASLVQTLDILTARDLTVLSESEFRQLSEAWTTPELELILQNFGGKLLEAISSPEVMDDDVFTAVGGLGADLLALAPQEIEQAVNVNYRNRDIGKAFSKLLEGEKTLYLHQARAKIAKTHEVARGLWQNSEVEVATKKARGRFSELLRAQHQQKALRRLAAVKDGTYSKEDAHVYELASADILGFKRTIEKEMADEANDEGRKAGRGKGASFDPSLIDWLAILDAEIVRSDRKDKELTFSKFWELLADLVFFLNDTSFAFLGSADLGMCNGGYTDAPYRRVGPKLRDAVGSVRALLREEGKMSAPPSPISCNNLLLLNATRKCWAEAADEVEFERRFDS